MGYTCYVRIMSKMCKRVRHTFAMCVMCGVITIILFALFEGCPMWMREPIEEIDIPQMMGDNRSIIQPHGRMELKANASSSIWDGISLTDLAKVVGNSQVISQRTKVIPRPVNASFHPGLDETYRKLMRNLIGSFAEIAERHNVTYFLYGGSLIGSYRHHGMVPWDDDIDVAVHTKDETKLKKIFEILPPGMKGTIGVGRWKISYREKPNLGGLPWSFPFLDISFFKVIPGFVMDGDPGWAIRFKYNITDVFPLTVRPFWDMWLPAPRHTQAVLERTYNPDICVSNSYSHRRELSIGVVYTLPCEKLKHNFPFVNRIKTNSSTVIENLVFNGKVIQTVTLST